MVKDGRTVEKFMRKLAAREPVDIEKNFAIYAALHRYAVATGKLPPADPLEGIEDDIRLAAALNGIQNPARCSRRTARRP